MGARKPQMRIRTRRPVYQSNQRVNINYRSKTWRPVHPSPTLETSRTTASIEGSLRARNLVVMARERFRSEQKKQKKQTQLKMNHGNSKNKRKNDEVQRKRNDNNRKYKDKGKVEYPLKKIHQESKDANIKANQIQDTTHGKITKISYYERGRKHKLPTKTYPGVVGRLQDSMSHVASIEVNVSKAHHLQGLTGKKLRKARNKAKRLAVVELQGSCPKEEKEQRKVKWWRNWSA